MTVSLLGALILTHPDDARARILEAVRAARGDRRLAAQHLGTTARSFYRFVERLHLWDAIDQQCDAMGIPRTTFRPPRSAEKIRTAILTRQGNLARAARALDVTPDALSERITELGMWDELNAVLTAAGLPRVVPYPVG